MTRLNPRTMIMHLLLHCMLLHFKRLPWRIDGNIVKSDLLRRGQSSSPGLYPVFGLLVWNIDKSTLSTRPIAQLTGVRGAWDVT